MWSNVKYGWIWCKLQFWKRLKNCGFVFSLLLFPMTFVLSSKFEPKILEIDGEISRKVDQNFNFWKRFWVLTRPERLETFLWQRFKRKCEKPEMGNWELPEDNTLDIEDVKADGSENDGVRNLFQLSVSICTIIHVIPVLYSCVTPGRIFSRFSWPKFVYG